VIAYLHSQILQAGRQDFEYERLRNLLSVNHVSESPAGSGADDRTGRSVRRPPDVGDETGSIV